MEGTTTKEAIIRPVFLKVGIPLVVSVAGYVFAQIMIRKSSVREASSSSETQVNSLKTMSFDEHRDEESLYTLDSTSRPRMEAEPDHISTATDHNNMPESIEIQDRYELLELVSLRNRVDDLQEREWKLERLFLRYQDLKDKELELVELQNTLLLEIARVEYLGREILSMEAQNQRFEDMVREYLKVLEQLEFSTWKNELLHRTTKKLICKLNERSQIIREQKKQIATKEADSSRNRRELGRQEDAVKVLNDENSKLKLVIERLRDEKNDLSNKLELAEESASSKIEAEKPMMEDSNQLVHELEQLQEDHAAKTKELIYLRWCNACLRHELIRKNQEQHEQAAKKVHFGVDLEKNTEIGHSGSDHELEPERQDSGSAPGHGEPCVGFINSGQGRAHSRRRKLIDKFKRLLEGEKAKQKMVEKGNYLR